MITNVDWMDLMGKEIFYKNSFQLVLYISNLFHNHSNFHKLIENPLKLIKNYFKPAKNNITLNFPHKRFLIEIYYHYFQVQYINHQYVTEFYV